MIYKVAIASDDGKSVNVHFGRISSLYIYEVDTDTGAFRCVADRQIRKEESAAEYAGGCFPSGGCSQGRNPILQQLPEQISDCEYLLVGKIGRHMAELARMLGMRVLETDLPIPEALEKLHAFRIKHSR